MVDEGGNATSTASTQAKGDKVVANESARALAKHIATATRNITPPTAATCIAENANTKKIGNAIALCTAQPTTGAIGNARAGTTRRVIVRPRDVQNSSATAAPNAA